MPGVETLYLLTSHECAAAIHLYEAAASFTTPGSWRYGGGYARGDVAMRYPL